MPLFRPHRGGYKESIRESVIVKKIDDIKDYLRVLYDIPDNKKFDIQVDDTMIFDERCGWDAHIVSTNNFTNDILLML